MHPSTILFAPVILATLITSSPLPAVNLDVRSRIGSSSDGYWKESFHHQRDEDAELLPRSRLGTFHYPNGKTTKFHTNPFLNKRDESIHEDADTEKANPYVHKGAESTATASTTVASSSSTTVPSATATAAATAAPDVDADDVAGADVAGADETYHYDDPSAAVDDEDFVYTYDDEDEN